MLELLFSYSIGSVLDSDPSVGRADIVKAKPSKEDGLSNNTKNGIFNINKENETKAKFNLEEDELALKGMKENGGGNKKQPIVSIKAALAIIKLMPTLNKIRNTLQFEMEMPESEYAEWGRSLMAAAGPHIK